MAIALPARADELSELQLVDFVTQQVMQRYQVARKDVKVTWIDNRLDSIVPEVPAGRLTLGIADTVHLGGRGAVPVELFVNGRLFRTIFPRMDIGVYQQVLVAKQVIPPGTAADNTNVALERTAVATNYEQPLTNLDALAGALALRQIPAGTVLTNGMFRVPPVVKLGDTVTVECLSGGLTIITTGTAQADGAVGQLIRVQNADSHQAYTARVVGPERVQVKVEDTP